MTHPQQTGHFCDRGFSFNNIRKLHFQVLKSV
jgi:hypothetical protein